MIYLVKFDSHLMMMVDNYLDNVYDDSLNWCMNNDLNEVFYYEIRKILDASNSVDLLLLNLM
jgi:hypothetical protein